MLFEEGIIAILFPVAILAVISWLNVVASSPAYDDHVFVVGFLRLMLLLVAAYTLITIVVVVPQVRF